MTCYSSRALFTSTYLAVKCTLGGERYKPLLIIVAMGHTQAQCKLTITRMAHPQMYCGNGTCVAVSNPVPCKVSMPHATTTPSHTNTILLKIKHSHITSLEIKLCYGSSYAMLNSFSLFPHTHLFYENSRQSRYTYQHSKLSSTGTTITSSSSTNSLSELDAGH